MGQTDKRESHRPAFFVKKERPQLIKGSASRLPFSRLSHDLCVLLCALDRSHANVDSVLNLSKAGEGCNFILNFNYNTLQVPTSYTNLPCLPSY